MRWNDDQVVSLGLRPGWCWMGNEVLMLDGRPGVVVRATRVGVGEDDPVLVLEDDQVGIGRAVWCWCWGGYPAFVLGGQGRTVLDERPRVGVGGSTTCCVRRTTICCWKGDRVWCWEDDQVGLERRPGVVVGKGGQVLRCWCLKGGDGWATMCSCGRAG